MIITHRPGQPVAIVTGAAAGIGRAIVDGFLASNIRVAAVDRDIDVVKSVFQDHIAAKQLLPVKADLTEPGCWNTIIAACLEAFAGLHILVNNAGMILRKEILATDEAQWDCQIDVNLKAAFFLSKLAAAEMKNTGWGRIINITSQASHTGGAVDCPIYAISKGGVNTMTRSFAKAFGRFGMTANAVAPGIVLTDMIEKTISAEQIGALVEAIPIGRATQAHEISTLVSYLASDASGSINGHILDINGGMVMR